MKKRSLLLVVFVLSACTPQTPAPNTAAATQAPVSAPAAEVVVTTGVLIYTAGEVEVQTTGTWTPIDTGETVSIDAKVRTGKKSACDIQFARLGVVHLAETTEISLKTIGVSSKKKAVDLELLTGAVTAKVSKLLGNDRFQVKTDTVVCGVRGTRFVVTKKTGTPTTVGVAEGSVAILPPTYDAKKFDDLAVSPEQNTLIQAIKNSILESSTTVGVGSQVVVTKASLEKPAEAVAKIEASLEQLPPPAPSSTPAGNAAAAPFVMPASVAQALESYQKAAPGPGTPIPKAQTAETKKSLVETATLQVQQALPVAPPKALTPPVSEVSPPVPAPPTAESAPKTVLFKVTTEPADAEVLVNGETQGRSPTGLNRPDGSSFALSVKKFGYQDFQQTIDPGKNDHIALTLTKINPVTVTALGTNRLLSLQSDGSGGLFAYDEKGNFTAFRRSEGPTKVLWTTAAGQTSAGIGIPSFFGPEAVFAGDKQLVGIDLSNGNRLFVQPLNDSNSGALGRRPLVTAGRTYLTSDQGLLVLDTKTGATTATIDLGEPADSTPAVLNGQIHVVGRNGTYFVVDPVSQKVLVKASTNLKQPVATAIVFAAGRAIIVDRKGTVVCLDPSDPSKPVFWEKKLDSNRSVSVFTDPVILGKMVYFLSKGTLYALSLQSGDPVGKPLSNVAGLPVESGTLVWTALSDGTLVGLNAGTVQVRLPSEMKVTGAPLVDGQSVLFPTSDGSIMVLRTDLAMLR